MLFAFLLPFILSISNSEICQSPEGVECNCDLIDNSIKISDCRKEGGWSDWSKWSQCRTGVRKRRRKCNNPTPLGFGHFCPGASLEKQTCHQVPEHLFGSWSNWNEWTSCDCVRKEQSRSRFCQGISCEGCNTEYKDCSKTCPDVRRWTHWSDWYLAMNRSEIRFRAFFSSQTMNIELVNQTRERLIDNVSWSSWKFTSTNIVYRFRVLSNTTIDFEHYTISRSLNSSIPLLLAIIIGVAGIVLGFSVQFLVNLVFSKFQYRMVNSSYSFSGVF